MPTASKMLRKGSKGELPVFVSVTQFHSRWIFGFILILAMGCGSNGQGSSRASPTELVKSSGSNGVAVDKEAGSSSRPIDLTVNGVFVALPPLPGGSRARHQLTVSGAALVITGGIAGEQVFSDILIFLSNKGLFERLPVALKDARFGHTATAVPGPDGVLGTRDDGVLVVGGCDDKKNAVSSIELIHPDPNGDGSFKDATIEQLTNLPFGMADHAAILAVRPENETQAAAVLITGGIAFTSDSKDRVSNSSVNVSQRGVPAVTNASLLYKVQYRSDGRGIGEIQSITQPQFARRGHSITLLSGPDKISGTFDDQVLIAGGIGYNISNLELGVAKQVIDSPEIFEPGLNRWTTVTLLGEARLKRGRSAHRAVATSKGVLLVGGASESGSMLTAIWLEIEATDPSLAEVRFAGELKQGREHPELAFSGGLIFVVGGFNERLDSPLDTVETFNSEDEAASFEELKGRLSSARVFHAIVEFDNRLIITGGYTQAGLPTEANAEFYNPVRAAK
jgi:hypothetical protein